MKIITEYPVIRISKQGIEEVLSEFRGGGRRGGGGWRGGFRGGRRHFHAAPVIIGDGMFFNGTYWVDPAGQCYTKNWLGQYTPADCSAPSAVELGL